VRLVLYTGKGGVGKTTTAAATAVRAAERGCRTLVVSADAAHSLGDVLDLRLGAAPLEVAPHLHALEIDVRAELERHWGSIRSFLVSLFVHQGLEAVVAEELALLPGAEELMTLLAVEELAASNTYDLVVLDCAPTDAALRLLTLPDVAHRSLRVLLPLFEAISGIAAPVLRKLLAIPLPGADVFGEADELLNRRLRALQTRVRDESTSVRLVVTPERMVIDEARRAWTELALFEVGCDAVVLNRRLPPEAAREEWFAERARLEEERQREVEALFAPHPVLVAPLQGDEVTGLDRLSELGAQLFRGLEPEALLSSPERVRFERADGGYSVVLPLPNVDPEQVSVVKLEDELTVTAGARRRSLVLPRRMAPLELTGARVDGARLYVTLRPADGPATDEPAT
jgi:arsenite-transporting ATPase